MAMDELDRILHRDDVAGPVSVDPVDHAGQGRGLAGTGGTGHQHQTLFIIREGEHTLRDVHLDRIGDTESDHSDDRSQGTPLSEDIDTEPA